MQFIIVLGILVTASSAYLVHQFWRRSLIDTEAPTPMVEEDAAERELHAA